MYSIILTRIAPGSVGELNMRLMVAADKPEPLCALRKIVHAVLRGIPSTLA